MENIKPEVYLNENFSLEKFNQENKDFKKDFFDRVKSGQSAFIGEITDIYLDPISEELPS